MRELTVVDDVLLAAGGDAGAWDRLVRRYTGLVWAVTRAHGVSGADAADVSQTVWLRLAEHLGRIRQPERVGAWLATTTRHESLRTLRRTARVVPRSWDFFDVVADGESEDVERRLLDQERHRSLWSAFESLSEECRRLLRVLMADPPPSYAEASAALGMPIGSIGPRRGRCIARLRERAVRTTAPSRGPAPDKEFEE